MSLNDIEIKIKNIYKKNKDYNVSRIDKHNGTQNDICNLAEEYGYRGKKEFLMPNYNNNGRNGKIDVVWYKEDIPQVAIEIDSSARPKSIHKLLEFNGQRIWIYYGSKEDKVKSLLRKHDKNKVINLIVINE